jgi:hypothetical protein
MAKQLKRIANRHLYTQYGDVLVKTHILDSKQEVQANGCIHWTGPRHRQGYGMIGGIRMPEQIAIMMTVHRLQMKIKLNRALLRSEEVIHTCGNMQCVNPDHLILGDSKKRAEITTINNPGMRTRHRTREPRKQNRVYRYSEAEILWIRTADPELIALQYRVTPGRARTMQWSMRKNYQWLK